VSLPPEPARRMVARGLTCCIRCGIVVKSPRRPIESAAYMATHLSSATRQRLHMPSGLRQYVPYRVVVLCILLSIATTFLLEFAGLLTIIFFVLVFWFAVEFIAAAVSAIRGRFLGISTATVLLAMLPTQYVLARALPYGHLALEVSSYQEAYEEQTASRPDAVGVFFPWHGYWSSRVIEGVCRIQHVHSAGRPLRAWVIGVEGWGIPAGDTLAAHRLQYLQELWGPWYRCGFK
jgi:hypothetical protein